MACHRPSQSWAQWFEKESPGGKDKCQLPGGAQGPKFPAAGGVSMEGLDLQLAWPACQLGLLGHVRKGLCSIKAGNWDVNGAKGWRRPRRHCLEGGD